MTDRPDRNIKEVISQLEDLLKEVTDLSKEIGVDVEVASMMHEDTDTVTGWVYVGDYARIFFSDGTCWWNYRPKVIKGDCFDSSLYKDNLDPSRIVSFTMPPREDEERP